MRGIFIHILFTIILLIVLPIIVCGGDKEKEEPEVKIRICDSYEIFNMDLEEYVKCVVASEMPAIFCEEALKAQAVAARTFAYKKINEISDKHEDADVCTDFRHCQAYKDKGIILEKWGDEKEIYWDKISRAVDETKNLVICFRGNLILPVFHANSVGLTESSKEIWSHKDIPYLQSVESPSVEDISSIKLNVKEFKDKILGEYKDVRFSSDVFKDIEIIRNDSNRVRYLKISGLKIAGEKVRKIFELRSTNFEIINIGNDMIKIEVLGNGHGVGLSQVGANEMAKCGENYQGILKHYYKGTNIVSIHDIMNNLTK